MGATTVKLDADILREIADAKPAGQTLSSFVRSALKRDMRRRKMKQAAEAYLALLARSPEERDAAEEWEAAPLAHAPRGRKA
jgi:hypothetical protein